MKIIRIGLAVVCLAASSFAGAQVKLSVRSHIDSWAMRHPSHSAANSLTRDLGFRTWKGDQEARLSSYAYRPILRFAECVSRFDKAAAARVLATPLQSSQSSHALDLAATANRGCVVEQGLVHPLLLRAALAETLIKQSTGSSPVAASTRPVGVPSVVDGYPLRRIARCQVSRQPGLVRELLNTQPSDAGERRAAEALFHKTAECGSATLGRLSPTAARLAIVEAEYLRRFVAGN